jgi:hypothetical protein
MSWAGMVLLGIKNYHEETEPLLDQRKYSEAIGSIDVTLGLISAAELYMNPGTIKKYNKGLRWRLTTLRDRCKEPVNERYVNMSREKIEERIHILDIASNSVIKAEKC